MYRDLINFSHTRLGTEHVIIIDPMADRNGENALPNKCACVSYIISRVLKELGFYKCRYVKSRLKDEIWVVPIPILKFYYYNMLFKLFRKS